MDSVNGTDGGRKERGQQIAAQNKIRHTPNGYLVPSQSGWGKYAVIVEGPKPKCTCPDHELHGGPCKHIYAVQIITQREFDFANGTVTETVSVTKTVKKTYVHNSPAYNAAQTTESDLFPALLRDLCRGIAEPPQGWASDGLGLPVRSFREAIVHGARMYAETAPASPTFGGRQSHRACSDQYDRGMPNTCSPT